MGRPKKIETTTEQKTVARTKKLPPKKIVTSRTGVELTECYCRKCMKMKKPELFMESVDGGFLDANGKMSICKDCCNEIYNLYFLADKNMGKAMLETCRTLNVRYDETALNATRDALQAMMEKGLNPDKIFGMYKTKLMNLQETSLRDRDKSEIFTFVEPNISVTENPMQEDEHDEAHNLKQFWGDNFEFEDYSWLEEEFSEWKKTHKIDTRSEISLLKMIVLKLFDIRKKRAIGQDTSALEKSFQELLKTSALTPAQSNVAGQGKSQDSFGLWIKEIEQTEPAEWWDKKRDSYLDMAGFDKYCADYITRPISNFFGVTKNFDLGDGEGFSDEVEDDSSSEMEV